VGRGGTESCGEGHLNGVCVGRKLGGWDETGNGILAVGLFYYSLEFSWCVKNRNPVRGGLFHLKLHGVHHGVGVQKRQEKFAMF